MAITKILARKGRLDVGIRYVLNGDKTQEQILTAHLNCDPGRELRQMLETKAQYQPSGEVIRLTNAINRGLEHPDDPQEVISLILQGVAARYACCPDTQEHTNRPLDVCWAHIRLAVSHINRSEEHTVQVTFQQEHRERTEHGTDSTEAGTDHTGNEKC